MNHHSLIDFKVTYAEPRNAGYTLLRLRPADDSKLPPMSGGQFVNVLVPQSHQTFLRRPISVHFVDTESNELWLLVKDAGPATRKMCESRIGERFNILLPLGNGFKAPAEKDAAILLVGGGVGVAPLLLWGAELKSSGYKPRFLLGARNIMELPPIADYSKYGDVEVTTDDGSAGLHGLVTAHPWLAERCDTIYCCGPLPMMKAVAKAARTTDSRCQVSLENRMACGLGACLCCVEQTNSGHRCVCADGPVFDTADLSWQ